MAFSTVQYSAGLARRARTPRRSHADSEAPANRFSGLARSAASGSVEARHRRSQHGAGAARLARRTEARRPGRAHTGHRHVPLLRGYRRPLIPRLVLVPALATAHADDVVALAANRPQKGVLAPLAQKRLLLVGISPVKSKTVDSNPYTQSFPIIIPLTLWFISS